MTTIKQPLFIPAVKADVQRSLTLSFFNNFNPPTVVLDDIKHGLFAKHPKARYVCGMDAKYFFRFQPFFPDWLTDFFIYCAFPYQKLNPK